MALVHKKGMHLDEDSATGSRSPRHLTPSGRLPELADIKLATKVVTACQGYSTGLERVHASIQGLMKKIEMSNRRQDGLQLYALSGRMGLKQATMKASHYTHRRDLSNSHVVSTIMSLSGDINALVALNDLRLRRTQERTTMIFKLKIQTHICSIHEKHCPGDEAVKMEVFCEKLAKVLEAPYPSCDKSFFTYLGMAGRKTPPSGTPGFYACFTDMDQEATTTLLRELIDEIPQEVYPSFMAR